MRHLLNTLFVNSEDIYLSLDGENVVANREKQVAVRYPLHTLSGLITFSYAGASPALMGACAKRNISLAFCTPRGKFLARSCGESSGNVLLRRTQYRVADTPAQSCRVARNMIFGKLYNCRWSVERTRRDHGLRVDGDALSSVSSTLKELLPLVERESLLDSLRGLEGTGATAYFSVLDQMILNGKDYFYFRGRSRRPPLDPFNAMLSFAYNVGFLHRDRPGRTSLALDLMEELRPCMADRFVLTLVNNRMVKAGDFREREGGAVFLSEEGRKRFLKSWQGKKQEALTHPYLEGKLPWGLAPYIQALLLARYLRGDLDAYPPFLWK